VLQSFNCSLLKTLECSAVVCTCEQLLDLWGSPFVEEQSYIPILVVVKIIIFVLNAKFYLKSFCDVISCGMLRQCVTVCMCVCEHLAVCLGTSGCPVLYLSYTSLKIHIWNSTQQNTYLSVQQIFHCMFYRVIWFVFFVLRKVCANNRLVVLSSGELKRILKLSELGVYTEVTKNIHLQNRLTNLMSFVNKSVQNSMLFISDGNKKYLSDMLFLCKQL